MSSSTKVNIDGLASAVMEGLTEYAEVSTEGMKEAVRSVAKKCKEEISAAAPVRTGKYAKSWATKVTGESANKLEITVYSRKAGLPHLLEHGHAKRGGGRTSAQVHIAPAEQNAIDELEKRITKTLED